MLSAVTENTDNKQIVTPREIRDLLGVTNEQIQELCREADIKLKKDSRGLTYFTKDDVSTLKNISDKNNVSNPLSVTKKPVILNGSNQLTATSLTQLVQSIKNIEDTLSKKVEHILDEKLDGMDDVVLELIHIKTENETLRFKLNELNKENYNLKKEISSFKKVALGLYKKERTDDKQLF